MRQHHGQPDRQRNLDQDRDKDDQAVIHKGLREGGITEQDLEILQTDKIGRRAVTVPAVKAVPRRLAHGQDDEQGKEQQGGRQKHQKGQRPVMRDRTLLALGLCRAARRYGRRSHGNIRHLYPLSWRQISSAAHSRRCHENRQISAVRMRPESAGRPLRRSSGRKRSRLKYR
ncbi:hypothetical protein D3C87_810460 [compost metagenome]